MSTENLNQGNFQRWYFPVHEDASQVQLHLETDVHLKKKNTTSYVEAFQKQEYGENSKWKLRHAIEEYEENSKWKLRHDIQEEYVGT
jgi:hypothetical protein